MYTYLPTTKDLKNKLNTRKKEFGIQAHQSLRTFNTASYWDGGSRNIYSVLNLAIGGYTYPPCGSYPNFQASYELPIGSVLISGGTFNGKLSTVTIDYYEVDKPIVEKWLGVTL